MKFSLSFILQIVYIIYTSEFIKIPTCVRTWGPFCTVSSDWWHSALGWAEPTWESTSQADPGELGVGRQKEANIPRRAAWRGENNREGGRQTWGWERKHKRVWRDARLEMEGEVPRAPPCWATSRHNHLQGSHLLLHYVPWPKVRHNLHVSSKGLVEWMMVCQNKNF